MKKRKNRLTIGELFYPLRLKLKIGCSPNGLLREDYFTGDFETLFITVQRVWAK